MAPAIYCCHVEVQNIRWLWNFFLWMLLHFIYIGYWLFHVIQLPFQLLNTVIVAVCFWPKFFWKLYGPSSEGRSIVDILRDPSGIGVKRHSRRYKETLAKREDLQSIPSSPRHGLCGMGATLVSLNPTLAKFNVFSTYQVEGEYSHLAGGINHQVAEGITAALDTRGCIPFLDNPLWLASAYYYIGTSIKEPPDCALQFFWTLGWDIFYSLNYLARGCCVLAWIRFARYFGWIEDEKKKSDDLHFHCLATEKQASSGRVTSFDADGIPFLIDSGADCIISNVRGLFVGEVKPANCTVTTHSGDDVRQRYVGTFRLELPDDDGVIHKYDVPNCIYDPWTVYNIIGIKKLTEFFDDEATGFNRKAKDGTRGRMGGTRSKLTWDHGKHKLHFMHAGGPGLPLLALYKETSRFEAFCTKISRIYDSTIQYAFSSAYSLAPDTDSDSDSDDDDSVKMCAFPTVTDEGEGDGWYKPKMCLPCAPNQKMDTPFQLGQSLLYSEISRHTKKKKTKVNTISVVYEGMSADGNTHTVRLPDGSLRAVEQSQLQDHLQPSFTNIPSTPLDYLNEVGKGISQEEAQHLARPRTLSPVQQELLSWHNRLYHLSFPKIFKLVRLGFLPKSLLKCEKTVPICLECQFGQGHRRPWRSKGKKSGSIQKKKEVEPGDGVSVDQIVSAQPGLVPQMSGFLTQDRIWGATTFVDHVSDYVYVHLMTEFTIEETLSAKKAFERIFTLAGRVVKSYRADNGRFADKKWHEDCNLLKQALTFCGVGNHRQNGKIEAKNKYLTLTARTLLLQGMRLWPEMISTYFWPFALKAAAERHNTLHVDDDGMTPESKLYGIKAEEIPVRNYHPLFCPVFVLDHRLHSAGGSIPKWEPRMRCGVYLGHSPLHAGNVALVFNPRTGRVSPAYHVVFDDGFTTVPYMKAAKLPPNWEDLVKNSAEIATIEKYELADEWIKEEIVVEQEPVADQSKITDPFAIVPAQADGDSSNDQATNSQGTRPLQPSEGDKSSKRVRFKDQIAADISTSSKRPKLNNNNEASTSTVSLDQSVVNVNADAEPEPNNLEMPKIIDLSTAGHRRSARLAEKRNKKDTRATANLTCRGVTLMAVSLFTAISTVGSISMPDHNFYRHGNNSQDQPQSFTHRMMTRFHEANELYDGTMNHLHLMSFVTQDLSSNEVFTYWQAMKEDDKALFKDAMEKEIEDHTTREHWELVPRSSMPKGKKAIKSIWSMKRKRNPIGELLKHKARLCAHGGMQQWGENYWETYSPVVNMLTVRLLLLICKIHKLHSKSIDFVLAFPQADLEEEIWMEIPLGVDVIPEEGDELEKDGYLLKLKKNLYGLKQGSHNWYKHLKEGLERRGLNASEIDPCLYLKDGMAVLTYVDDCIIISKSKSAIDELIESLQNGEEKFILTDEGDIDKFLGIEIKHFKDGSFEISQPHLIKRIITLLQLDKNNEWGKPTNPRPIPGQRILGRDHAGEDRHYEQHWNYRTAVGMLTYLQGNSRPEIAVHVHQCARFSINPKRSHEAAILNIGRYLLGSQDRGIIYKPDKTKGLECYVDADFAGGWQLADSESADNVLSRTGYVLMYAGCPIHWVSKLQTEIALSTAEAEYIALSQALREVIPLMSMMKELQTAFPIEIQNPNFNCTVHEDNQSCISMATKQKFSPRTKHIALKYHHFRSYVNSKKINIQYIDTKQQIADGLTKPLGTDLFFNIRKMLCGW